MKNHPIRGFINLVGETIKKIDSSCINVIYIETESGKIITVDCDEQHIGVGIINCKLNIKGVRK